MSESWSGSARDDETLTVAEGRATHPRASDAGPEAARALVPGNTLGRYVVVERLGIGGMGEVVRAYDPRLRREVALKRLRSRALDEAGEARLVREARAMATLSHPNVVAVYDVTVEGDGVTLAMEYVAGETLLQWIGDGRSWHEARPVFLGAGAALAAAHRRGLVHRDFKPANVLLGSDGAVKVTDFGLAKRPVVSVSAEISTTGVDDSPESLELVAEDEDLTVDGMIVGSPAYMAPEQHRGPADAKADQYAFCVTLWETLVGTRPFSGRRRTLTQAKLDGPPPWPSTVHVPRKVVAAVRRGLSPNPEDRWPDMQALLTTLGSARRRRTGVMALGVLAVGLLGAAATSFAARDAPCSGAEQKMESVWNPSRAEQLRAELDATGVPYASKTATDLTASLDAYARQWREQYTEACEATTVRGEQSQAVLDRRMTCLDRGRTRMDAAIGVLIDVDAESVAHAADVVQGLPRLVRCADLDALAQDVPPPSDPRVAEAVQDGQQRLARVQALKEAGRTDAALEALQGLDERAMEHPPFRTEVEVERMQLLDDAGQYEASTQAGQTALQIALESGQWELAFEAAIRLGHVHGRRLDHFEPAEAYLDTARGLAKRPELTALHQASLAAVEGELSMARGDDASALEALDRAIEIQSRELEPGDPGRLPARQARADALANLGRHSDAVAEQRSLVEGSQRAYGDSHPYVAIAWNNFAFALVGAEAFEEAESALSKTLAIHEETVGADHPFTGVARDNHAYVLRRLGRLEEAAAEHRRAVDIIAGALGEDHRDVGRARDNLGGTLVALGRLQEAEEQHRMALAIFEKSLGIGHPDALQARNLLGNVLAKQKRTGEANELWRDVLRILDNADDPTATALASAEVQLGALLLKNEEGEAGLVHLEQAWKRIADDDEAPVRLRIGAAWTLTKALADSDTVRAVELARVARALAADAGDPRVDEIEAWLAERDGE